MNGPNEDRPELSPWLNYESDVADDREADAIEAALEMAAEFGSESDDRE